MHKNVFRILYMFSHPHFADSISHFIRCPFSHFRIFALRILYVPGHLGLGVGVKTSLVILRGGGLRA